MRPTISPAFSRAVLDGHSLLGVIFGALVYIVCFSGALIVPVDQLTLWERPETPIVREASPELLNRVGAQAFARAKAVGVAHDLYVTAPTRELPHLTVFAHGEKDEEHQWSADARGNLMLMEDPPFVALVQDLHFNLTAPGAFGRYLVGIVGTLLLASIVTGLLAHRRILKDAFRLRWGGSRRLANADLHNRIGVWALPFHLIVALTGSLLGLSGLIIMVLALVAYRGDQDKAITALLGPQATTDARPAPLPDIRPMLAGIEARAPGSTPAMIAYEHVGTAGQQVAIYVAAPGHLTRAEQWTFDGAGHLKAKAGFTDGNLGMRIYGMITPLHYGTYGGIALKIIYALLGAGLTMIVATGGNIWLARRRDQGRASPRLEKLWAALVWGQPVALASVAIAALLGIGPALPLYWSITAGIMAFALRFADGVRVTCLLRGAGGLLLLALPLAHLALGHGVGFVAIAVDLVLLLLGALLAQSSIGDGVWRASRIGRSLVVPVSEGVAE